VQEDVEGVVQEIHFIPLAAVSWYGVPTPIVRRERKQVRTAIVLLSVLLAANVSPVTLRAEPEPAVADTGPAPPTPQPPPQDNTKPAGKTPPHAAFSALLAFFAIGFILLVVCFPSRRIRRQD
jgi:hypothetical protein